MSAFTDRLTNDVLDAARQIGDPPADEVVRQVVERDGPEVAGRLFHTLIRRLELPLDELPDPLPAFVRGQGHTHGLADDHLRSSEDVFRDHGPKVLLALYHASLPRVYACPGVARVLVGTGRLAHDDTSLLIFSRRIAETGQFLVDIMAPGGMRAGGHGVETALKVRLIHASIRHFLRPRWDEALGAPINQEDMALTLMTFGVTIVDALDALGARLSEAEADGYLHTWNAVGRILGIQEDLLPGTPADARFLQQRILDRQSMATAEGALLTKALVEYAGQLLEGRDARAAPALLIRYLVGDGMATRLGVARGRRWWSFLIPVAFRLGLGGLERLEDASEPVARLTDRLSGHVVRGMVGSFNAYKGQPFRIPRSLRQAWGVD